MVVIGHKVSSRKNSQVIHISQNLACQSFNLTNPLNLVSKKLNPKGMFIARSWENLDYISPNTEFPPLKVDVIALKLDIYQVIEKFITRNLQTWTQADYAIGIFLRRTQTIDTRNRCDYNDIVTLQQS